MFYACPAFFPPTDVVPGYTQKSRQIIDEIIRYENTIIGHENTIQ